MKFYPEYSKFDWIICRVLAILLIAFAFVLILYFDEEPVDFVIVIIVSIPVFISFFLLFWGSVIRKRGIYSQDNKLFYRRFELKRITPEELSCVVIVPACFRGRLGHVYMTKRDKYGQLQQMFFAFLLGNIKSEMLCISCWDSIIFEKNYGKYILGKAFFSSSLINDVRCQKADIQIIQAESISNM